MPATPEIYTLSLHDALPICPRLYRVRRGENTSLLLGSKPRRLQSAVVHLRHDPGRDEASLQRLGRVRHRSEEHTSELQSLRHLVCRLLLEKKKRAGTEARRS